MATSDIDELLEWLQKRKAMCCYAVDNQAADIPQARQLSKWIAAVEGLRAFKANHLPEMCDGN